METLASIALLAYILVYFPIWWANKSAKEEPVKLGEIDEPFSLIIPFHNESENLAKLIGSIQDSVLQPQEVILIDDYSEDEGKTIITELIADLPYFKYLSNTNEQGKKSALTMGIEKAKNNLIVTTDADCIFHPLWLNRLVGTHLLKGNNFTFGLVEYVHTTHWLGIYEWMESRALMATGIGMFRMGYPVMCNGANLAFNKDGWQEAGGYESKKEVQGGDDIFLMHALWKKDKSKVGYCLEEEAVIYTQAGEKFKQFMRQRRRWMGKTGKYDVPIANFFPFLIGLVNLSILASFILLLVKGLIGVAVGVLIVKAMIDYLVILSLKQGFRSCVSFPMLMQYQLFQLIYPFFLPLFKSDWKH